MEKETTKTKCPYTNFKDKVMKYIGILRTPRKEYGGMPACPFVGPSDVILIPDGYFHKVWNESETEDLIFVCVFDGKRNH